MKFTEDEMNINMKTDLHIISQVLGMFRPMENYLK